MPELIPVFEVGEKVVLSYHPYECFCPVCGHQWGMSEPPFKETVTIVPHPAGAFHCGHCENAIPLPNGFYKTSHILPNGWNAAVPYTLLTKIRKESR